MKTREEFQIETVARVLPCALEAIASYSGDAFDVPIWARKLGAVIGTDLLPASTFTAARTNPSDFFVGLIVGGAIHGAPFEPLNAAIVSEMPTANVKEMTGFSYTQAQEVLPEVLSSIPQLMANYLAEEPSKRRVFFAGFVTGLDIDLLRNQMVERFNVSFTNPKSLFARHLFMWAHWKHLETLDGPEEAFIYCHKSFSEIGRGDIVGSKSSFRKFCDRIGYFERARRLSEDAARSSADSKKSLT